MAKEVYRKAKPSPPNWFWPKNDGCWDCYCKRHGCGGCKRLKTLNHVQVEKNNKKQKQKLKEYF